LEDSKEKILKRMPDAVGIMGLEVEEDVVK
jgi:hypothetical protein